jgi:CO/xanthine dehydrogenase Mo-binding subunit
LASPTASPTTPEAAAQAVSAPEPGLRFVGRRTRRSDAPQRLTGKTRFTADLPVPGLLHARLVHSPYAAARIMSIDTAAALAVSGVVGVYTARDLPLPDVAKSTADRSVLLALDRVWYAGHPVAVVLGETEAAAEDGAAEVQVAYEPLPAVVDITRAGDPDAPIVREDQAAETEEMATHGGGSGSQAATTPPAHPNVPDQVSFTRGDVQQGFKDAAVVVERTFATSWIHQGYLEPKVSLATLDALGQLVIYTSTQALVRTREAVEEALGLEPHGVTIHALPVGGGFGGKSVGFEPLVGALTQATGRPVRLVFTRVEELLTGRPTPSTSIRVAVGANAEGQLTTLKADLLYDSGSSPGSPLSIGALLIGSLYRWHHLLLTGREVLTNKTTSGAYRGPGAVQAVFALESVVDEVARELEIDPLELRRRNAVKEGDPMANGRAWPGIGLSQCLERAAPVWSAERAAAGPGEGVGLAVGAWMGGLEPATAYCRLEPDGSIRLMVGSVDLAGTNSTFELLAAETFGTHPSQVKVVTLDSREAPYQGPTVGSKTMYSVGPAILEAARDARDQVLQIAASILEAAPDDLEIAEGAVRVKGVPSKTVPLKTIHQRSTGMGARFKSVQGRGRTVMDRQAPGFAVHIARVHVDADTGRVTPLRYIAVQDVGKAINPSLVEGQMQGAVVQAVGWSLFERLEYDAEGQPLITSLMDYALPKASQAPQIQVEMVEVPAPLGPYGAKGVGEPPVIPGPAAIANAIRAAMGVRITRLPITSEALAQALRI